MLSDHNMAEVKENAGSSSDTGEWVKVGVPGVELFSYNEDYFHYHHTHGIDLFHFLFEINCVDEWQ